MTCAPDRTALHILMTIGCLNIGGAERRLLQLLKQVQTLNLEIRFSFYVISGKNGVLDNDFREAGATIFYGKTGALGLIELQRICRLIKPDILHANSGTAAGFYCVAARLGGVKRTISHIRSAGPVGSSGKGRRGLIYEPLTGLSSDIVVGVSKASLVGKRFGKVAQRVVYNGLDPLEGAVAAGLAAPPGYVSGGPNYVILGRLDRLKNVPHAITSFAKIVTDVGNSAGRLHIVGPEGNISERSLRELVHDLGLEKRIIFHGSTDSPLRFYQHADCALLASDYEGLPGSALEALSCGTPVVASDIASAREVAELTVGLSVVPVTEITAWSAQMVSSLKSDRSLIKSSFWSESPFTIDHHILEMLDLWGIKPV